MVVQDHVPIRFGCGVHKSIHKPVSITWAYLVRHGSELRRVPIVTKDNTVVRIKSDGPLALTLIIHVLHQVNYS